MFNLDLSPSEIRKLMDEIPTEDMLKYLETSEATPKLAEVMTKVTGVGNPNDPNNPCQCPVCRMERGEKISLSEQQRFSKQLLEECVVRSEEIFVRLYVFIRQLLEEHLATKDEFSKFNIEHFKHIVPAGTHADEVSKDQLRELTIARLKWALRQLGEG